VGDLSQVPTSRLALTRATRHGWTLGGTVVHERRYLDFSVDGRSLRASLGNGDYVTLFGWLAPWIEEEAARRLLLEAPASLDGCRQELYVCPECADLGCGALTAVVERAGDRIVWRDFGYQDGTEAVSRQRYRAVGPLVFEGAAYEQAIRSALSRTRDEPG
jgi:hypothetical protein